MGKLIYWLVSGFLVSGCAQIERNTPVVFVAGNELDHRLRSIRGNPWYRQAEGAIVASTQAMENIVLSAGAAKNIIVFVGDGMGVSTVTAARILEGQNLGFSGEEHSLSFDRFPFSGLVKTYNVDAQTPDSAGTMTAIMSGVKTNFGVVGVDQHVQRGNCASQSGSELVSALMLAEVAGMSTGVISTARITHATPAATYAVSVERNWEDISNMPVAAVDAGCEDIALQLVQFEDRLERLSGVEVDGLELALGGGRRHFLPTTVVNDPSVESDSTLETAPVEPRVGLRNDGRDLIDEWQIKYKKGRYVDTAASLSALNPMDKGPVLGLFSDSHMRYAADRLAVINTEPSLSDMTAKGIDLLIGNPEGFFLVVEAGRIDHGHHATSAYNALTDAVELSTAVGLAVAKTNPRETLILVTADHGHVMTIAGYPRRGNPILGVVVPPDSDQPAQDVEGRPYTTLGYQNGRGFQHLPGATNADLAYAQPINAGRHDLSEVDTGSGGFHQEVLVPLAAETHSGADVAVYASGPGAHLATGTLEQSVLFHIMNHAANLSVRAAAAIE